MVKRTVLLLSLITVMVVGMGVETYAKTAKEWATVINLSGRQRMLTQKMTKEMLLIAIKHDADANRSNLKKTADLFDKTLKGLIHGDANVGLPATASKATLKKFSEVENLWGKYKNVVDKVVAGGDVDIPTIAKLNMPLLKTMNECVSLYAKDAKKETGKEAGVVINLAGKQRMLTQKMTKESLLVLLEHEADMNKDNLRKTADLFDKTLKGLKDGDSDLGLPPTKNTKIVAQLIEVRELWNNFKPVIDKVLDGSATKDNVSTLAKLNLPLLKEMNKAVKMYEAEEK